MVSIIQDIHRLRDMTIPQMRSIFNKIEAQIRWSIKRGGDIEDIDDALNAEYNASANKYDTTQDLKYKFFKDGIRYLMRLCQDVQ